MRGRDAGSVVRPRGVSGKERPRHVESGRKQLPKLR